MSSHPFTRRKFLRGAIQGSSVYMALPFLNCFLNNSGTAMANGAPIPVRFGTWFWGCGVNSDRWVPAKVGSGYEITPELKHLEAFREKINVLSGFNVLLDGHSNFVHHTGNTGIRAGAPPETPKTVAGETFDVTIAREIGNSTRFRSLDVTATGDAKNSYSYLSSTIANPAETSPIALYTRIFGPEFQNPNGGEFKPDPKVMLRKSVLSAVQEDRQKFVRQLGMEDRQRMDQYFTSLREVEQQLALQLQKPAPLQACVIPEKPSELPPGTNIDSVVHNHDAIMRLLAMALACIQTHVINVVFSDAASTLRRPGTSVTHHLMTHEEMDDPQLGYQPTTTWFIERSMQSLGSALQILSDVREGDRTLLDNMLLVAHSDCNYARIHQVEGVPMIMAGGAGGRLRTGLHIAGNGDSAARVGLTAQQAMGLAVDSWGGGAMRTNRPLSEAMA